MTEKEFALDIKNTLTKDNNEIVDAEEVIDVSVGYPLHQLEDMNLTKLQNECEKLGVYMIFSNQTKTNRKQNLAYWKKCPSVIFTFDKNL